MPDAEIGPFIDRYVDGLKAAGAASLVATMLELLGLAEGMTVLEIGAGTGYNAALMAEIVGGQHLVVTVGVRDDVVAQTRRLLAGAGYPGIRVLLRDGFEGVPERAPFDRIVATVGWRACWTPDGPGLSSMRDGWAALGPAGIRWWRDRSLATELDRLFRKWEARAHPPPLPPTRRSGTMSCRSGRSTARGRTAG
jgi:SAM-dependent methyltransferase